MKKAIQWYAREAQKAGYLRGKYGNGGGWIKIASAIGEPVASKQAARRVLEARFGKAPLFEGKRPEVRANPRAVADAAHVNSDAFLQSYEWRRVRMEVLKKHGARCQCCGATPADGVRMHVDHIKPRRIFPALALDASNLQVLCEECNHGKGNWDMTDWREDQPEVESLEQQHMRSIAREGR